MAQPRPGPTTRVSTWKTAEGQATRAEDTLATEEPLEVRLVVGSRRYPVAVTMRTPGADFELAVGFLFNEGVIRDRSQLRSVSYCVDAGIGEEQRYNIVNVEVGGGVRAADLAPLERHFSITSACGVCGRATIDDLVDRGLAPLPEGPQVQPTVLHELPAAMRKAQRVFESTGGLHAAGLFQATGELVALREDVGRHNALDKLTGWALMAGRLPLRDHVMMVSGRSSFELVQKTVSVGAPVLCSVSAPSSLAVGLANRLNLTLVGFLRAERFNIYAAPQRVRTAPRVLRA